MKLPETNCLRCNHPQKFGQRQKTLSNGEIEVYIQCKMCRWKKVIMIGSDSKIYLLKQIKQLRIRTEKDPSLRKVLLKRIATLKKLEATEQQQKQ